MKVKKILVWSLVNNKAHKLLTKKERAIKGSMPIIKALFPGINYYSITGFYSVRNQYLIPVLKKLFPRLQGADPKLMSRSDKIKIKKFLGSNGYQWQYDVKWQKKLHKLLAA